MDHNLFLKVYTWLSWSLITAAGAATSYRSLWVRYVEFNVLFFLSSKFVTQELLFMLQVAFGMGINKPDGLWIVLIILISNFWIQMFLPFQFFSSTVW